MECKVSIGDIVRVAKRSIAPQPGVMYRHYSLPAFDDRRRPEVADGGNIRSNKFIVDSNTILMNKLNVRFKRVWPVLDCGERAIASTEFIPLKVEKADFWYMYYLLISPDLTSKLERMRTGTSGSHQRIDVSAFLSTQVDLPSIDDQVAVGFLLRTLDQKIELNNRINDYLAA